MDVLLITFSQTGNTREIADAMADALREAGHLARTIPLKEAIPDDTTKVDLLGVGTPCFSSQSPTPIKEFLRSLPSLYGQRSFVFATSSGAPGRVLYDLASLLRGKGSEVLGGFLARGEVHHPAPHMAGQFPGRPTEEDFIRARQFAISVAEHVSTNRDGQLLNNRLDAFMSGLGFYDLMGLALSDKMLRLMMPEPKLDTERCDHCRWCVDECPMGNISLLSAPILGDRCIRCYHCLNGCPQKAFHADWRFADPLLRFLYNATFMRWFGDLKPGEHIY
jgi:ferredoxin/flavodoxin